MKCATQNTPPSTSYPKPETIICTKMVYVESLYGTTPAALKVNKFRIVIYLGSKEYTIEMKIADSV